MDGHLELEPPIVQPAGPLRHLQGDDYELGPLKRAKIKGRYVRQAGTTPFRLIVHYDSGLVHVTTDDGSPAFPIVTKLMVDAAFATGTQDLFVPISVDKSSSDLRCRTPEPPKLVAILHQMAEKPIRT